MSRSTEWTNEPYCSELIKQRHCSLFHSFQSYELFLRSPVYHELRITWTRTEGTLCCRLHTVSQSQFQHSLGLHLSLEHLGPKVLYQHVISPHAFAHFAYTNIFQVYSYFMFRRDECSLISTMGTLTNTEYPINSRIPNDISNLPVDSRTNNVQ